MLLPNEIRKKPPRSIRACKLGIRQPQTGSFRARHRCLCSEYRSSIPAPGASPDTKISLFAVLRSFARGIFRPDDIEKSGNTCCIPGFFCDGWAEKGRAKPAVSLICTPFSVDPCSFVNAVRQESGNSTEGAGKTPRRRNVIDIGPAFSYNDASTKRKKPAIRSPCSVSTGGRGAVHCRKPSDPARPALQASPKAYSGKENSPWKTTRNGKCGN